MVYRLKQGDDDRYTVGVEFLDFVNTSREELLERIRSWQDDEVPSRNRS